MTTKKHRCPEHGCSSDGFPRRYELERHKKSKHNHLPQVGDKRFYRCADSSCQNKQIWARADHLRQHGRRFHPALDMVDYVRRSTIDHSKSRFRDRRQPFTETNHFQANATPALDPVTRSASVEFPPTAYSGVEEMTHLQIPIYASAASCCWQDSDINQHESVDSAIGFIRRNPSDRRQKSARILPHHSVNQADLPEVNATGCRERSTGTIAAVGQPNTDLAHPRPIRASTCASKLLALDSTDGGTIQVNPRKSALTCPRPSSAPPVLISLRVVGNGPLAKVLCTTPRTRTCVGGQDRYGGQYQQRSGTTSGNGRQQQDFGSNRAGKSQLGGNFENHQPGTSRGNPGKRKACGAESYEYPCVYHNWPDGVGDPTGNCATLQRYISKLWKHHQAQGHPNGPFLYCTRCFCHDFPTEAAAIAHRGQGCAFVCVTEDCPNYNRQPASGTACYHGTGHNSQYYIWRKLYRIAHGLGPRDPVPDTRQRRVEVASLSSSAAAIPAQFNSFLPTAALSSVYLDVTHLPPRPTSLPPPQPQELSVPVANYFEMPGITPSTSPSTASLPATSEDSHRADMLSTVQEGLERLARAMWPRVNCLQPGWSRLIYGWYYSVMEESQLREQFGNPQLAGRISSLRTLVQEYQSLIDGNEHMRSFQAWGEITQATQAILNIETPEWSPWLHHQVFNTSQDSNFSRSVFSMQPDPNMGQTYSMPSNDGTMDCNLHAFNAGLIRGPEYAPLHPDVDYDLEADASAGSTPWERMQNRTRSMAPVPRNNYQPSFAASENAESAYVSGPASEPNHIGDGKARSEGSAGPLSNNYQRQWSQ